MEPFLDCNFPELLAVDLEKSGRRSRLTSLRPEVSTMAMAAERKKALVLEELSLGAITSPREKELLSKMKSLEILGKKYSELLALGEELMRDPSDSDMSASDSSGGVEPPCIRTRKLSITTPATSITSGRKCSQSTCTSASTSPQNQVPSRSWLDFEEGSPDIEHKRYSRTIREDRFPSVSSPRQTSARYVRRPESMRSRRRGPDSHAPDPFANFGDSMDDEDDTIMALPYHDDIHSQHRPSSSPRNKYEHKNRRVPGYRECTSYGRRAQGSPRSPPSPSWIVPSTGIINENSTKFQSWSGWGQQKQPGIITQHQEYGDIAEDSESQDSQSVFSDGPLEPSTPACPYEPAQQHESIETWFQTVIDDFSHPFESDLETPITKLPISSDVLETLRVSVSCFPETMLLCSSLSIETIRSHARKVKYESKCTLDLQPASTPIQNGGKGLKASNWRRFKSIARKHHNETAFNTPIAAPTNFGLEEEKSTWPDSSPVWASIKNIFPNGTDYLCDALYAHILTYNHIDSLCPRLPASTAPQATRPQTARKSIDNNPSPAGQKRSNVRTPRIPRKAASLLGLQNSIAEDHSPTPSMPPTPSQASRSRHPSISSSTVSRSNTTNAAIITGNVKNRNILRSKRSYVISKKLGVDPGYIYPDLPQPLQQQSFTPSTPKGVSKRQSSIAGNLSSSGMNGVVTPDMPVFPRLSSAEQSLVDLRTGLSKCITRLIATLKMTSCSDDAGDEGTLTALAVDVYEGDATSRGFGKNGAAARQSGAAGGSGSNAVDAFLMRSLCELVRVSECSGKGSR